MAIDVNREIPGFEVPAFYALAMAMRRVLEPSFSLEIPEVPAWVEGHGGDTMSATVGSAASGWQMEHWRAYVGPGDVGQELEWSVKALGLLDAQKLQLRMHKFGGRLAPKVTVWLEAPEPVASQILLLLQKAGA